MEEISKSLPDYERPPVIEVVCGILFKSIDKLLAPHLGLLWEKYKTEYPVCREVPPLAPVIERFEEAPRIDLQLADVPPLPRIWFVDEKENGIIQVQRDRFLHNWKKVLPEDEYPRYPQVIEPEPADSRGVFPANCRRKVLFTKKVKLKTSDLPRWKPKAIIGLQTFEEEDV